MVNLPDKRDFKLLQDFNEPYCLTIYAPYIEPNSSRNPNRIELKNLLQEARKTLLEAGDSAKNIDMALLPAENLINSSEFWPIHHEGLVLFIHSKFFRYYHVSDDNLPYMITVENHFNFEPLKEIIDSNKQYFVLVLGHNHVNLYHGDKYHLEPVKLTGFPYNMKDTLQIDEYSKSLETHEIAPSYIGKGSGATHEQYDKSRIDKDYLLQYFRIIDKQLHHYLLTKDMPLVLAGVDYLLPIYRQVNNYQALINADLKGNFDHASLSEIQQKVWPLINTIHEPSLRLV